MKDKKIGKMFVLAFVVLVVTLMPVSMGAGINIDNLNANNNDNVNNNLNANNNDNVNNNNVENNFHNNIVNFFNNLRNAYPIFNWFWNILSNLIY